MSVLRTSAGNAKIRQHHRLPAGPSTGPLHHPEVPLNLLKTAVLFAASATLVAGMAGTASADTGGDPASAVPPGCSFSHGVTTCTTTSTSLGTPSSTTAPAGFQSTTGPVYDLEYAWNPSGNCTPGAPQLTGTTTTTTTPSTVTTTTTAHYGAPGSHGQQLPTQVSTAPGPTVTTSTTEPASPGTVTIVGTTANAVFTGLQPNTTYGIGVRCSLDVTEFTTDAQGAATATLNLSSFSGRLIQIELFLAPYQYFGVDYAVTAPLTVS
jgi:hypothetical protein